MSARIILIILLPIFCKTFAQEPERRISFSNSFGAGTQFFPPSKGNGISPQIFYRLILKGKRSNLLCLTGDLAYRWGSASYTTGGQGGSETTSGSFKLLRGEIGLNYLWALGAEKTIYWGLGLGGGQLLTASGNAKKESWVSYKGTSEAAIPIQNCLEQTTLNINTELCKEIIDGKRNSLFLGIRLGVSTSDWFSYGPVSSTTVFVSYNFTTKNTN